MTTDFGLADGFVGVIKGVILSIAPGAQVIDISHVVKPWDLASAAWIIGNSWKYFPTNTIHVAVVDPGVGTSRRPIAVIGQAGAFVGPDNGVFSLIYEQCADWQAYELTNEKFWLPTLSTTFHGRDIFAPVAAALSNGVAAGELGARLDAASLVSLPKPPLKTAKDTIDGAVVYVDGFGNLITNITRDQIAQGDICLIDGQPIGPITTTYASADKGKASAMIGSHGCLEIGINQGRACEVLGCGIGKPVQVRRAPGKTRRVDESAH